MKPTLSTDQSTLLFRQSLVEEIKEWTYAKVHRRMILIGPFLSSRPRTNKNDLVCGLAFF